MQISLPQELERIVQSQVASGLYRSPTEVIREALRIMEERNLLIHCQHESLKRDIAEGLLQADKSLFVSSSPDKIMKKVRKRLESKR